MVVTWLSVHQIQYLENLDSTINMGASLILLICYGLLIAVKTRYPLTSIMWPYHVLRFRTHWGHVFLKVDSWPGTGFSIAGSSQVTTLRKKEGVRAKTRFWCKLTSGMLWTFLLICSLCNCPLECPLECPWCTTYIIFTKPHAEQLHAHNWSYFEFLIQEKQILLFSFMVNFWNQELRF